MSIKKTSNFFKKTPVYASSLQTNITNLNNLEIASSGKNPPRKDWLITPCKPPQPGRFGEASTTQYSAPVHSFPDSPYYNAGRGFLYATVLLLLLNNQQLSGYAVRKVGAKGW